MSAGAEPPPGPVGPDVLHNSNGQYRNSESLGMEQIRKLLFGAQVEDFERRFSKQEERVLQKFQDVESETTQKLNAFDTSARSQIESLVAQLREETALRADQTLALEKRIRSLSDQLGQFQREITDRIAQESQLLRDELKRKSVETQSVIDTVFSELKNAKVDRHLLSGLFVELATCLSQGAPPMAPALGKEDANTDSIT